MSSESHHATGLLYYATQNLHPKPGLWEFFAYPDGGRYVGNQASTNFLPNNAVQAIFGLTGQVLPWAQSTFSL